MRRERLVEETFTRYRETGDQSLRNWLIEEHEYLAVHCAQRFACRGEPFDDLLQVARLGILKAVERFSPDYGTTFATFAVPTAMGELRRHFRDRTWALRVPRGLKDRYLRVKATAEEETVRRGRPPTTSEIARLLGLSEDDVLEALEVGTNYRAVPLTRPREAEGTDDDTEVDGTSMAQRDVGLESADARLAVQTALAHLPKRERTIVYLRFYCGLTQTEIAQQIGVSQVHVSRLLRQSLAKCATALQDVEPSLADAGAEVCRSS
jgi:RNA polymerase sigma-B factor